jgi:hypothetical protein
MKNDREVPPVADPEAKLERALIEEYLHQHGHHLAELDGLADEERRRLLREASVFAAGRLAEIEARWHYVEDLHRHE